MEQFNNRIEYIDNELGNSNDIIAKKADQLKEIVHSIYIIDNKDTACYRRKQADQRSEL